MIEPQIKSIVRAFMDATMQDHIAYNLELALSFREKAIQCRKEARKTGKPVQWFRRVNGYTDTFDYNGWSGMVRAVIVWIDELENERW